MKNLDKKIEKALIEHAKSTTTFDRYGQHMIFDMQITRFIPAGDRATVREHLKSGKSKSFGLSTYANRNFKYEAINIIDNEVSTKYAEAIRRNPHRVAYLNAW